MYRFNKIIIFVLMVVLFVSMLVGCDGEKSTNSENSLCTIIIDSSPDELNAPWLLSGPYSYSISGTGIDTVKELSPGDYTGSWGLIPDWITPLEITQTLMAGETVTFHGIYEEEPGPETGTVTDIDGNVYQTIKIGNQWWMTENLKVTHYRNGDPIPNVTDSVEWANLSTGAYCNYDNNEEFNTIYGRLYNWFAVDDERNIAPSGWHVPTDKEWKTLEIFLGMDSISADGRGSRGTDEGGKLKQVGTTHWIFPNVGATNESGFTALAGGYRSTSNYYDFRAMGNWASYWTMSEENWIYAWKRDLIYIRSSINRERHSKGSGYSIRCVKD